MTNEQFEIHCEWLKMILGEQRNINNHLNKLRSDTFWILLVMILPLIFVIIGAIVGVLKFFL